VLIRSAVATFQSRGDTRTPMHCFFAGLAINVALKLTLSGPLGPAGLAFGTAAGAWVNFALLLWLGRRRGFTQRDDRLSENIALIGFAAAGAALATPWLLGGVGLIGHGLPLLRNEFIVVTTFAALSLAYAGLFAMATLLFGRTPRRQLF
jgi:putative peptidoglycan lipid II flippase